MKMAIPTELIPKQLWNEDILHLPSSLSDSYVDELRDKSLYEDHCQGSKETAFHGGSSIEETHAHFVHRFSVSAGRPEYVLLDPGENLSEISEALSSTFSDGKIAVLDLACGTGAGICSLLSTLITLRRESVFPKMPLQIVIVGGDYSDSARAICQSMIARLQSDLEDVYISVTFEIIDWDASRSDMTNQLVERWFNIAGDDTDEYVFIINNFSGALKNATFYASFTPCLELILARLSDKNSTFLWIESGTKDSGKLLDKIRKFIEERITWFANKVAAPSSINYQFKQPITDKVHRSEVRVHRFERD